MPPPAVPAGLGGTGAGARAALGVAPARWRAALGVAPARWRAALGRRLTGAGRPALGLRVVLRNAQPGLEPGDLAGELAHLLGKAGQARIGRLPLPHASQSLVDEAPLPVAKVRGALVGLRGKCHFLVPANLGNLAVQVAGVRPGPEPALHRQHAGTKRAQAGQGRLSAPQLPPAAPASADHLDGRLLALVAVQQLDDLLADPVQVGAQAHQHLGGHALALADDLLDLLAHRFQADPQRLQGLGGHALALEDQPEQDVLGADVVVAEHPGLFLCQDHNPPRPVGKPLEHCPRSSRWRTACRSPVGYDDMHGPQLGWSLRCPGWCSFLAPAGEAARRWRQAAQCEMRGAFQEMNLVTASTRPAPIFDPFAPGFTDDPYPQYAALREDAPVYQHPLGFWLLTRHEDVSALLRAPDVSVESRNVTGPLRDLVEADYREQPRGGLSMLDRDPPDHTRLRRLVSRAFTSHAVQALRPRIEHLVDGMLDEIARIRHADLVQALAFPLPFTVIAELLGTPPADHQRIRELSGTLVRSLEPVSDPGLFAAIVAARDELAAIAAEMIAWKRRHPANDLLTALINAEDDGDVLDDQELIAQTLLLYLAGHETTVNLLAGGTLALLRNPGQLDVLRRDPGLIPNAVEELLRYDSPVQVSRRITLRPVSLHGTVLPEGSFILLSLASANRDRRAFGPDADRVRVSRENARQHVSFGGGPHHCLGASLARLEAEVAFGRMITRLPGLALDGEVIWNGRINLRGPARLPVRVAGTSARDARSAAG